MNTLSCVIIEDEISSQNLLKKIIEDYCPILSLKGIAGSIDEGMTLLHSQDIDLVFLDINLGYDNSFDLLDKIPEQNFKVIFTTAHEEYALKAFKYEAIDYILKPYSPKDIIAAAERAKDKFSEKRMLNRLMSLSNDENIKIVENIKISISTSEGIMIYDTKNITRIEGNGSYCQIYFVEGNNSLIAKSLKEFESILPGNFFRSHDSHIINLQHVMQYKKLDGGTIMLINDQEAPVSRRKKQEFLEALKAHTNEL